MLDEGFRRPLFDLVRARLEEPRARLQVLAGPRKTGETTLARQVLAQIGIPARYASADQPTLQDRGWLQAQWEIGRLRARDAGRGALLMLDEAQKITAWSGVCGQLGREIRADPCPALVVPRDARRVRVRPGAVPLLRRLPGSGRPRR